MRRTFFPRQRGAFVSICVLLCIFFACQKHTEIGTKEDAKAQFSFEALTGSVNKYRFLNQSTNASTIYWNMGDGNKYYATDTVVYQFTEKGVYSVTLYAIGASGNIDSIKQNVNITQTYNPWVEILSGGTSKTWVLAPIDKALVVGPLPAQTCCPTMGDPPQYANNWWASTIADVTTRSCTFRTTYTFDYSGTLTRDIKGSFWSDPVYAPNPASCLDAATYWTGGLASFGNGSFSYAINLTTKELTMTGLGSYIGLYKVQETNDASANPQPIDKIVYKIYSLTTTQLILYKDLPNGGIPNGERWYFTLQPQ